MSIKSVIRRQKYPSILSLSYEEYIVSICIRVSYMANHIRIGWKQYTYDTYTKGPANVLKFPVHEAGQIQSKFIASL